METVTRKAKQQGNGEAGFTLLETSIAMVLLAVVGLGIASVFFFAAKNNVTASDRELSMAVAQQQMEQFRNVAFSDASLAATATAGTSATVIRAGRRYQVLTTIVNSNVIDGTARTKTITIRVTPWSDGSSVSQTVTSVFGSVTMVTERTSQETGPNRAF
ncbi:MAG TPA: prepilin-type N-terminal cleavage/methylation domain-containing protein [Pyrinomonadaceae bacterium]|nr:prepilin-type N-terminal cleavage/methylation domain-containing protein [Pyrinomonadaceae bacterium]